MKQKIIFATSNEGKMKEIKVLLADLNKDILSMKEAGIEVDIVEDGSTFEENAMIKAKAIMELTGEIALADDSGLEVDYMNKEPGIYSARFLGEDTSYHIKNNYIIEQLKNATGQERSARFVCAIACAFPNGEIITTRGVMEGLIGEQETGTNGFGYDPIFFLPEYGCSAAELSLEEKNLVSHRGKALKEMKKRMEKRNEDINCQ